MCVRVQRWGRKAHSSGPRPGHLFRFLGSLPLKMDFLHNYSLFWLLFEYFEPLSSFSGKDGSLDLYTPHHNH